MKFKLIYIILFLSFICSTCKKPTTITIRVINQKLNEYVTGAKVVLLEIKNTHFGNSSGDCRIVEEIETDDNGIAVINNKLRKSSKYQYKIGVSESWGVVHRSPCNSQRNDYIDVGKNQEIILSDNLETTISIQYNNLLTPSISGDSIIVGVSTVVYTNLDGVIQGGGGVFGDYRCNPFCGYPYPSTILYSGIKTDASRLLVNIRKKKMGIITSTIDTVRAYPNQTNLIQINW